ncbi:BQ2448_1663 [Microbotryum intermedium]|uniref:BQ2448_1663 protein n=1 Tax=Microbotryum intermedium TaxID=269621 RepID=A0A238FBV4_9BASI|nr:BQ2448_1663 [Microbotryum intermedium]
MLFASTLTALVLLSAHLAPVAARDHHHDSHPAAHDEAARAKPRSFEIKVNVPLKRDFLNADGTINEARVKRAVDHQRQRHRRRPANSLETLTDVERKIQADLFKRAQELEQDYNANKAKSVSKNAGASPAPLIADGYQWGTDVHFGDRTKSKGQRLTLFLDTLDYSTFVAKIGCLTGGTPYNPSKSPTTADRKTSYSDKEIGQGYRYEDTLSIGDFTIPKQGFIAIDKPGGNQSLEDVLFYRSTFSGVLGLGRNPPSIHPRVLNPVENLHKSGAIHQSLYAVKITDEGGALHIGSIDHNSYVGNMVWAPLLDTNDWHIPIDGWLFGSSSVLKPKTQSALVFSTTNGLISIPRSTARALFQVKTDEELPFDRATSLYYHPCDNLRNEYWGFSVRDQVFKFPLSSLKLAGEPSCARAKS